MYSAFSSLFFFRSGPRRAPGLFCARILCVLVGLGILLCGADPAAAKSRRISVENKKYADIVMDAATGQVLHQTNPDKPLHPASLTKMMTLLLLFDAMEAGQIGTGDRIPVSARAASVVPSKLGLKPGSSIRVEDAIYALVTKSANDVAVAIAEALGGTETRFAGMMTRKAAELGMT
ncbi:MAG TPA: serine hydrolase, partial [Alphaproteobacteria bacterium]|nr:serine hydrolase [Alphaproteobacteria bacterium]